MALEHRALLSGCCSASSTCSSVVPAVAQSSRYAMQGALTSKLTSLLHSEQQNIYFGRTHMPCSRP